MKTVIFTPFVIVGLVTLAANEVNPTAGIGVDDSLLAGPSKAAIKAITNPADRFLDGEVTVVQIPWKFKDGKVEWTFNPTALPGRGPLNHEWVWQLNRHGEWELLAKAYRATKDEKYARGFARSLESWLDQTTGVPGEDQGIYQNAYSPFRTIEEGIRLMGPWPEAWNAFKNSPSFPEPLKARFKASMHAQADHLMRRHTRNNWLLMELNGVHSWACLFPEYPEAERFRRESARIFAAEIAKQVLPDGCQFELSPDYHRVFYYCAAPLYERALQNGFVHELPKEYRTTLERGAQAYLDLMTPSFTEPQFNDTFVNPNASTLLAIAAKLFPERRDFLWAATKGAQGEKPKGENASKLLPWSGYAAMRSGWELDATYCAFDFGPLGMGHWHQDKLNFVFYKGGEPLVFDDGGGQYTSGDPFREYALSGYDHNVLVVDGLAQFRNNPRRLDSPIDPSWESTPERDYAKAVYDQGFGKDERRLVNHTREISLAKSSGVLTLVDTVESVDGQPHTCELLFHLDTTKTEISADKRRLIARYGRKWNLAIETMEGGVISTATAQTSPRIAGWYCGRGDITRHPATTVFITAPTAKKVIFRTLLTPILSTGNSEGK